MAHVGGRLIIGFTLVIIALIGCVKTEVVASKKYDEVYTEFYKRGVNVKTETRTRSGKLLRVHFNSDAGTSDSVYFQDSTGSLRFLGVHKNTYPDTLYVYDTITGNITYRCYFIKNVAVRTIRYWENGKIKSDFVIDTIIEIDSPMDSVTRVIEVNQYYSGYAKLYDENGWITSEGPIDKDEHSGIWIYYGLNGEIKRRDTL